MRDRPVPAAMHPFRPVPLAVALLALSGGAALAQNGEVTLDPLTVTIGPVTYRVAAATLSDTSLSREDAARLLSDGAGEDLQARLRRFSAKAVSIPEIVAEVTTPEGVQTTTYRDVRLADVVEGRIGTLGAASGSLAGAAGAGGGSGTFGRLEVSGFDLPYTAALYGGGSPDGELQPVYGAVSLADLRVTDASGAATRIARLSGRDLRARPTREGWAASLAALADAPGAAGAEPAARQRVASTMSELLDAFAFGSVEADDITVGDGPNPAGRIAHVAVTGSTGGEVPAFRLDGVDLPSDGSRVRIGRAEMGGTGAATILRRLIEFADVPPDSIGAGALRGLVPPTGFVRVSDLSVDVATGKPAAPGQPGAGDRSALAALELTLDRPVEGVPTTIRLAATGLDLPTRSAEGGIEPLAALGYDRLAGSASAELGWQEGTGEIVLRDLSARGTGIGSLRATATFGNATRDLFSPDTALATVALVGLTLKSLDLRLENGGLADRVVSREAAEKGVSAEDVRRNYGVAAAIGIPALIGGTPAARAIGQAAARFVAKPGRFALTARSKDPAGVGFADLGPAPDPATTLERFDVTATAD